MDMDFTPVTLRNVGVPLRLAVLDLDGKETYDTAGKPITETGHLRFDNNVLAEFEGTFGSVQKFVDAIDTAPYQTLRMALAVAWEVEPRVAANRIPNDENGLADTVAALFVALAISQGVDPTRAATAYPATVAALRKAQASITADLSGLLDSIAIPSTPPSVESTSETNSEPPSDSETSSEAESFPTVAV